METIAASHRLSDRLGKRPADPRLVWRNKARPEQLLPAGTDWRVTYWQGGRGSGKNFSCSGGMADWVLSDTDPSAEYGIIAPTYADAWTKCVEGKTGILKALGTSMSEIKDHRSATVRSAWRTYGQVILHSGVVIYVDSAAEGGLRVQGRNLSGAWCSEIGLWDKWETAWKESVNFAVRAGRSQIIADGTPKASRKARKLIRGLIRNDPEYGGVIVRKLRTRDNIANLSEAFVRAVIGGFKGTRLELQELEGELLDDVANALWTRDLLDAIQCPGVGEEGGPELLIGKVLGVDPSDGSEESDEQAYTLMGMGTGGDPHIYVAENWGGQEAPAPFARRCIRKAVEEGAMIAVEKNHGGAWLKEVFAQAQKDMGTHVLVKLIHASQAKRSRAEPVSLMYDRTAPDGRPLVLHCHRTRRLNCTCEDHAHPDGHLVPDEHMPELEDQMATFTGAQGERSPDRLDSMVWAATCYLKKAFGPQPASVSLRWAMSAELAEADSSDAVRELELVGGSPRPATGRKARLQGLHGGLLDGDAPWSTDDWAPYDSPEDAARRDHPAGNTFEWR